MHVHACTNDSVRTTIELSEEQRAALLHLAAKRGMKGFSHLVEEALDRYLEQQASRQSLIDAALGVRGALKGKSADELAERVEELRDHWR
jgi:predicted transcriptional regulator